MRGLTELNNNDALNAKEKYETAVESAYDYIERFDLLETITNVGNDEVFTPRKTCNMLLDILPEEVWHNPNYKWLNPATKNGVFEREIAIRLNEGLKEKIPDEETRKKHILQKMIYSIGQTKFTSNVARRTLYYCSEANRKCDGIKANDGHYVNGYAIGNGTWFDTKEGNIYTPKVEHQFDKKGKCIFCGIDIKSSYNDGRQREHYAYEFIHYESADLISKFKDVFFKGDENMKFDIIIGNPPYQLSDGGGTGDSARPIYNIFIENAITLNPKYLSMIVPSRWMKGGKGLDVFRKNIISDKRIKKLFDYENANEVFPNVNIDGGVCYFLWDNNYNGKCEYHFKAHNSDDFITSNRFLKNPYSNIIIRDNREESIIGKVYNLNEDKMTQIVSTRNPYGINADLFNKPENYQHLNLSFQYKEKYIKIYGVKGNKGGAKRVVGYVDSQSFADCKTNIDNYKLFFSKAYSSDATVPPKIIKAIPGEICTETFLEIGPFKTEEECDNCLKYIKTKFFRALLKFGRAGMNISQKSFIYVPTQLFLNKSDINWNEEIENINGQLYKKYNFSRDEINFIEKNIDIMND